MLNLARKGAVDEHTLVKEVEEVVDKVHVRLGQGTKTIPELHLGKSGALELHRPRRAIPLLESEIPPL